MKRVNLLFIAWDGPQTNYMEGLFLPIFQKIQELYPQYRFHVLQFTWGDSERIKITEDKAICSGVVYNSFKVYRKPFTGIGSIITISKGIRYIKKYIQQHNIDAVMPRATLPAIMVNRLKSHVKLIFDADGLPIEERVDFAGLKRNSIQYKILKNEENKMLRRADAIITRSDKATNIHVSNIGERYKYKFYKVINGRDVKYFKPDEVVRNLLRNQLEIRLNEKVFIYVGSLGPQYCLDEMIEIFKKYLEIDKDVRFIMLTGSLSFLEEKIPSPILEKFIIKTVPIEEIPAYLNAADIAFAIRKPSYSMQGVAPIKLSEYLLTGISIIASKGIGDSENILDSIPGCFLYNHDDVNRIDNAVKWISCNKANRENISLLAKDRFSLEASAKDYVKALQSCYVYQ